MAGSYEQAFEYFPCLERGRIVVARYGNDRRGVAALEFAILTPVLFLMLLGMICFGVYLTFAHELQELSSSSARSSVAGLSDAERSSLAQQFVANDVSQSALLNMSDLTVQTATSGSPPIEYSVTVSYNLKDTPIPMLASLVSLNLPNISRTSHHPVWRILIWPGAT